MAFIYDNWMRGLLEEDDDPAEPREQEALLSYLNGTMTADEAAHGWTKQVTESENRSAEPIWSLLIDAAEEFPQAHQKLLELLDAIAHLLTTEKGMARKSEESLPHFVFELHDTFNGKSNVFLFLLLKADVMYCRYRECLTKQSFDDHR